MAKGRVRSRMELREQYEAAEAREREKAAEIEDDEDLGDLDEADDEGETTTEASAKKKKAKVVGEAKPSRKKAAKVVRKRVVWVVYDNSNKPIQTFNYPNKAEADALAEKLTAERKQTYFVQPVKEEIKE